MNFSDSEIVASILSKDGYTPTDKAENADLVLLNTCSIREKAEYTVLQRINEMNTIKSRNKGMKVGVLGCMAERMREDLLEKKKVVDLVVGPDAYRTLPDLLEQVGTGQKAVNVLLSREETYGEIEPVRLNSNGVTAFVTIMRGCDNMCAFCVVPFTRGRERSREPSTIVDECKTLAVKGYGEVTLLGQNVDSFKWKLTEEEALVDFADLLEMVALACPTLRIRYSTSHPKDMTDKVLAVMAKYENIAKYIHLPVQSGSNEVLHRMNRGYTREWYLDRISSIRKHMPDCALSTDVITGFCGETEEDHQQTLRLMEEVGYDMAFMFKYSERPKTLAARKYPDEVPEEAKGRRLQEVINTQRTLSSARMATYMDSAREVLIEGISKRSEEHMFGRISQGAVTIVSRTLNGAGLAHLQVSNDVSSETTGLGEIELIPGDLVDVKIISSTAGALKGEVVGLRTVRSLAQLKEKRTEGTAAE
ncbi:MAG: tRNA (N6-isopentenyl adenosine(37)-C2)-methylthiotransferase MiaB [Flavobacteriales bacterium]|nr:tRNA (N6-isopentenyl adenosine(37)-C2)-methylthiotransferase MiaB [Flavobacteriales bacterium]MBK6943782.1 tRNA (N6-isopentenyl adenosine(37)-C2)-methylthiotransferase MiaB [Flavobacteriales bacterium]MBK7239993.1 tRNA (N6-isopentenyl adenosine(37)-C2)-methylthiotransferase MiaB [Flavobacteriales bacterium]MBK9535686.1 tRNA (N6-isopentenyl adenosine(37)-C2)-methylthiotransferase MiaB [Flavobacteriales bacterium]MBP9138103.1 tRNA (N6-isopentenyl adenosine(37)-C2)-methylthiotransferase MiaB [F